MPFETRLSACSPGRQSLGVRDETVFRDERQEEDYLTADFNDTRSLRLENGRRRARDPDFLGKLRLTTAMTVRGKDGRRLVDW